MPNRYDGVAVGSIVIRCFEAYREPFAEEWHGPASLRRRRVRTSYAPRNQT